ncbi:neutral zinc metallopeptidase [Aurantiacibacter suaedae]|uniref:KPN_02809 family neutral zinc metallopeptidase n=1 Tax=Aurantiacibacter suaedae TaxID=2545755 RepID=UPI0010F6D9B8|nr:neutral zinc metallopeptidase [Aurantiacibacter suaedae]
MKLNPFDPSKINVRRGGGGGGGMPGGKLGCGGIVVVLIGVFVFGMDPAQMLGTVEQMQGSGQQQSAPANPNESVSDICDDSQYAMEACNALASLDQTWQTRFAEEGLGDRFAKPTLALYQGGTRTACGAGSAAMGPFYCPGDQTIYIDTSFYDTLDRQLGAGGDFARYYVIAHEYGHHIQTITGISDQIRSAQQSDSQNANRYQVLMELQADCYAGVWAGLNRNAIEPGDFEEGMTAASAIGDDALTGGRVSEDNFTHGTSQQRMEALRLGLSTGDDRRCDEIVQVR